MNLIWDWLNDWSIDWLIDWNNNWLIRWLIDWLIDQLKNWLKYCLKHTWGWCWSDGVTSESGTWGSRLSGNCGSSADRTGCSAPRRGTPRTGTRPLSGARSGRGVYTRWQDTHRPQSWPTCLSHNAGLKHKWFLSCIL